MQQNTENKNAALSELQDKEREGAMQQPNSQTTDNPLESQWEGVFNFYERLPTYGANFGAKLSGDQRHFRNRTARNDIRHSINGRSN
jgi:hypothetical protein